MKKIIIGSKTFKDGELWSDGFEETVEIPDDAEPFNITYIDPFTVVQYVRLIKED